jgi:hypothetical protein
MGGRISDLAEERRWSSMADGLSAQDDQDRTHADVSSPAKKE